jgi:hypothetical protein
MRIVLSLCFALAGSAVFAEDGYTIKLKEKTDLGKSTTSRSISKNAGSMKMFDADGKLLFEKEGGGSEYEWRTTVLETDTKGEIKKWLFVE